MGNYLVLKNNYRRLLAHRISILMIFAVPVIICLITLISSYVQNESIRVGILTSSESDSMAVEEVKEVLKGYDFIDYRLADQSSMYTDQIMGKYSYLLDLREEAKGKQSLDTLLKLLQAKGDEGKGLTSTERTIALLMTVFLILSTVHASNYIDDRKTGVLQRYTFAPRRRYSYIGGYTLFTLTLVFLQVAISLGILVLLQSSMHISLLKAVIVVTFITLVTSLFAILFTLISKSDMQANLCSSAFSVIMMLLGGTFVPIESMPKIFRVISVISPVRWILNLI
ncbi:MAG TPA: ABC transporter permease [Lachnospiraceae bacterium]|nr:ABC transporter permease [Lachnospiraceae bacterium]